MIPLLPEGSTYTEEEKIRIFGVPGIESEVSKRVISIKTPYGMRLYTRDAPITKWNLRCHKLVADRVLEVMNLTLEYYGFGGIEELGLDVFSGDYVVRKIRRGTIWSAHAFACAFDFLHLENGLETPFEKATFSRPEYDEWHRIWESQGFVNLGRVKGFERDAMHFELGRISGL